MSEEKKRRVLLVDGNWLLKRSFFAYSVVNAYKNRCGGAFGFVIGLQSVIKKTIPDRVVIMWDGFQSGKFRLDKFNLYKANRQGKWTQERDVLSQKVRNQGDQDELDLYVQKMYVKNLMQEFFIRQLDVDYIEGDDLIAGYIIDNKKDNRNEEIVIFSRDKDFRQLVSDDVSLITPDIITPITIESFQRKIGHVVENELLFKCFNGDSSDGIPGVKGIKIDHKGNTLERYIPDIRDRKYTFKEIVDECNLLKEQKKYKKNKTLDKIIDAGEVLYKNAELMDLNRPFLSEESKVELKGVAHDYLPLDGSIERAMQMLKEDGYVRLMRERHYHVSDFYAPFHRIISKEKQFREEQIKKINN